MIDFNLINECLSCIPVFIASFVACLILFTFCICCFLIEKTISSSKARKIKKG